MGKIQQFFKKIIDRFRKKPIALPEAVDTRTEEPGPTKRDFREEVKFDPLNPEVCKGIQFYQNILRSLGVREEILKNPDFLELFITHITNYCNDNKIEPPNPNEPTQESIQQLIDIIRNNSPIESDERNEKYQQWHQEFLHDDEIGQEGRMKNPRDNYSRLGFEIDPKTGNVRIQSIFEYRSFPKHYMGMRESQFYIDEQGHVVRKIEISEVGKNNNDQYTELPKEVTIDKYNKHGFQISQEYTRYHHIESETGEKMTGITSDIVIHKTETDLMYRFSRDSSMPFLTEFEVVDGDLKLYNPNVTFESGTKKFFISSADTFAYTLSFLSRGEGLYIDPEQAVKRYMEHDKGYRANVITRHSYRFGKPNARNQLEGMRLNSIDETEEDWRRSTGELEL